MRIICHSRSSYPPIYVETEGLDWNSWRYTGSQWENLMGHSWEMVEPPKELEKEFSEIIDWYS